MPALMPSAALPHLERGELRALGQRLHAGAARLHRAAAAGRLGTGGLPAHRHRRYRGQERGGRLPGAVPHA